MFLYKIKKKKISAQTKIMILKIFIKNFFFIYRKYFALHLFFYITTPFLQYLIFPQCNWNLELTIKLKLYIIYEYLIKKKLEKERKIIKKLINYPGKQGPHREGCRDLPLLFSSLLYLLHWVKSTHRSDTW